MISKYNFRIKKTGELYSECYCRNPELIENYDKAVADTKQIWQVHHRLECCFTYKFLVDMGLYYDVEPEALIFLTPSDHSKIDSKCKRHSEAKKGQKCSEEAKRKISKSLKNRKDQSKQVLCIETCEIFESAYDAHRKTGINRGSISQVCLGKRNIAGGLHWQFV